MPDEIRCPMCAKNNPAGTEICRYCGARLTPLGKTPTPPPLSGSAPDWLNDLRSTTGEEPASLPWQDQPAEDLPDWLSEVRGSVDDDAVSSSDSVSSENSKADWLAGLPDQPETPAQASDEPGVEDWLANLRDPSDPQPGQTDAHLPDSTSSEKTDFSATGPAQSLPGAGEDADLAEWLKSLDSEGAGGAAIFSETASQPEPEFKWTDASDEDTKNQQTGVTEWLNSVAYEPPPVPPASSETPPLDAWLANEGVVREPGTVLPMAAPEPASAEPLPDWLSDFPSSVQEDQPAQAQGPAAEPDVPAWLAGFRSEETPTQPSPAVSASSDEQPIPDWMTGFTAAEPPAQVPVEPAQPPAENMPGWLSGFGEEPVQPDAASAPLNEERMASPASQPEPELPVADQPPALEIPDFAAMFAEEAPEAHAEVQFEDSQPETPSQAQPVQPPPVEAPVQPLEVGQATPDWFADFAEAGKEPLSQAPGLPDTGQLPFIDPQVPDWLSTVQPPAGPASPANGPALFEEAPQSQPDLDSNAPFQVELPDWLEEAKPAEVEASTASTEENEELAHADLPDWVQEMRPLESIIPGAAAVTAGDPQRVEKAGPLAGMRGVLAPEEPAAHFRKLPAYTAKLRVSERQRAHAGLLQNLLEIETQPYVVSSEPSQTPQYLYRLVVAIVLILALLAGMFMGGLNLFPVPSPTASDAGLLALYNEIESVPPGAPVLVAVDYEPGLSGEMRMASTSVIEHLMVRGVKITLVSTVPTGPVLAQQLLEVVQQRQPDYNLADRTVNLGYLPGGTTSLLEFSQRPDRAAPLDYQGYVVWNRPALNGIRTIQDYSLVVVLTDSTETGRAWVEQVQPLLGSVPLTMVASAQAGPLLLPYFDSGQIKGLLSGFLGGAMYEQQTGRVNLANTFWNSYQTGYVAGILMLIVGGVISVGLNITRKPRKSKT